MKRQYYLFLSLLLLTACQSSVVKEVTIAEKIKGDWFGAKGVFSIEDSLSTYVQPYGNYVHYVLKKDTLILKHVVRELSSNIEHERYHFLVDSVDDTCLFLQTLTSDTKKLFNRLEPKEEVPIQLTLKRTTAKNKATLKSIGLYAVKFSRQTTAMYLEIDSLGNLYFHGKHHTEKDGMWSGKLQPENFAILTTKIRAIPLDRLKESYQSSDRMDGLLFAIKLVTSDGVYRVEVGGIDEEPVELRFLVNKLMQVYRLASLEKDSTIQDKFQFEELQQSFTPSKPPPLPLNRIEEKK